MNDETISEAFKSLETDYLKAWGATTPTQTDEREAYWRAIQILGDVRRHLALMYSNGKIARKELEGLVQKAA